MEKLFLSYIWWLLWLNAWPFKMILLWTLLKKSPVWHSVLNNDSFLRICSPSPPQQWVKDNETARTISQFRNSKHYPAPITWSEYYVLGAMLSSAVIIVFVLSTNLYGKCKGLHDFKDWALPHCATSLSGASSILSPFGKLKTKLAPGKPVMNTSSGTI